MFHNVFFGYAETQTDSISLEHLYVENKSILLRHFQCAMGNVLKHVRAASANRTKAAILVFNSFRQGR